MNRFDCEFALSSQALYHTLHVCFYLSQPSNNQQQKRGRVKSTLVTQHLHATRLTASTRVEQRPAYLQRLCKAGIHSTRWTPTSRTYATTNCVCRRALLETCTQLETVVIYTQTTDIARRGHISASSHTHTHTHTHTLLFVHP